MLVSQLSFVTDIPKEALKRGQFCCHLMSMLCISVQPFYSVFGTFPIILTNAGLGLYRAWWINRIDNFNGIRNGLINRCKLVSGLVTD